MSKKNKASEQKTGVAKNPSVDRAPVEEHIPDGLESSLIGRGSVAAGDGEPIDILAARLHDPRLDTIQRQALAAEIGRLGGNKFLGQVIARDRIDPAIIQREMTIEQLREEDNRPERIRFQIGRPADLDGLLRLMRNDLTGTLSEQVWTPIVTRMESDLGEDLGGLLARTEGQDRVDFRVEITWASSTAVERMSLVGPAAAPAAAPAAETEAEEEPGPSPEERAQEVEQQLSPLFGEYWQRARNLVLQYLPPDQDPLRVNWKIVTREPAVPAEGPFMPLQDLSFPGIGSGTGPEGSLVRVQRIKCESGFYLTRPGNSFTIGVNLAAGTVSFSWGSLKLTAFQGMEVTQQVGDFAVGISLSLLNPASAGVGWKLGYENKGESQSIPGGYTFEPYIEWCIEGDLSMYGRAALTAVYAVAGRAAVGVAFLVARALAVRLLAAGPALAQIIRSLVEAGPRWVPAPVPG